MGTHPCALNQALFDDIFQALIGPVMLVSLSNLVVIRANAAAEGLYGYGHGKMAGISLTEIAADISRAGDFLLHRRSFVPLRYVRRSDGLHIPVEIRVRYTDTDGHQLAVLALRELTEQMQTRQRDSALELQYRAVFEAAPYPIVLLASNGTVIKANPCATELYGYGDTAWTNLSLAELIPSERSRSNQPLFARPTFIGATEHLRADGTTFLAEATLSYLRLNQHTHAIMIVNDVTEAHTTLERLRAAEERWRFALEGAEDEVWDWDISRAELETSSRQHLKIESPGRQREHDAKWMGRVHPEDRTSVRNALDACLRGHTPLFSTEFRLVDAGGNFRWNAARGKVMSRDDSGKPARMIGTFRDIHDIKLRAEISRRQQNELAHAGRLILLGEMASVLAHELNQPLTALNNFSTLCLQGLTTLPETQAAPLRKPLEMIRDQARRAGEIVHRVRGFVRKGVPKLSNLDIKTLVLRVLEMTEFEIRELGIQVRTDFDLELPSVSADRVQIEQVMVNLIKNALDAMRDNAVERTLTISTRRLNAQSAEIRVGDNGTGFSPDQRTQAFELFRTSKPDGLGLGLSICRSIVEAHGGQLYIECNTECGPENGTVLIFDLPFTTCKNS